MSLGQLVSAHNNHARSFYEVEGNAVVELRRQTDLLVESIEELRLNPAKVRVLESGVSLQLLSFIVEGLDLFELVLN